MFLSSGGRVCPLCRMFCSEYQTIDEVQKPSNTNCNVYEGCSNEPIHRAASKCSLMQVITWLWHDTPAIDHELCKRTGALQQTGNVTQLYSTVPCAESIQRGSMSCHSLFCYWLLKLALNDPDITINTLHHCGTLWDFCTTIKTSALACSQEMSSCCTTMPIPTGHAARCYTIPHRVQTCHHGPSRKHWRPTDSSSRWCCGSSSSLGNSCGGDQSTGCCVSGMPASVPSTLLDRVSFEHSVHLHQNPLELLLSLLLFWLAISVDRWWMPTRCGTLSRPLNGWRSWQNSNHYG